MATTKPQKDKLFPVTPAPKLVPRPTAASTARAALNASNRNLNMTNMPLAQRTSPNRASTSPNLKRKNSSCQRSLPDTQTKPDPHMDTKINTRTLQERVTNIDDGKIDKDFESQLFHEPPSIVSEDSQEEFQQDNGSDIDNNNYDENNESDAHYSDDKPDSVDTGNRDVKLVEPVIVSSQPQTPFPSRPHTPKSLARTRTSAGGSRPSTPSTISSLRHTTPVSRPTTPQRPLIKPRPNSNLQTPQPDLLNARVSHEITPQPNIPFETFINLTNDTLQLMDNGDLKSVYAAKQKQFQQMKKELDLKQQAVLELFEHLRSLRERMPQESESGGGEGALQELLMFNVADWPAEEVAQLCHEAVSTDGAVQLIESMPVDECTLNEVESKIQSIPELFGELCLEAFSARQELIDWVKDLLHRNCLQESGEGETVQRIANYNLQGHQLCDALRELKDRADSAVRTFSSVSKRVWRDQNALMSVGKSLVRDIARLKQDLGVHSNIINEMRQERSETRKNSLEEARQELEEERTAKNSLKEKLTLAEYQLRQSRMRITKMDRQLHEAEASITSLTSTVKSLEEQSRQRDALVESRARKLKESVKMGEVASGHLAQQRDALQAEVTELKDQIEKLTNQHKSSIRDLKIQLKETKSALEEQRQTNHNKELELRAEKDAALAEGQATVHRLEAKIKELENKTEQNLPTPREMELLAEVQATKVALRLVEEEVVVCKREKVRFLETLTKIADSENKVGMQQKLAAELLSKEDVIAKMQIQMREVIKNDKLLEQKVIQYERYISDLQAYNTEINNAEYCNETKNQDLQKEILDLRMKLLEAVHRNEELTEALGQKDQQLDQQDKTSRAQARVIKVREELINMLKSKETEQSRELSALQQDLEHRMKIVDEVNKQIAAKAVEIQELFATLESKQQQIHRLEKIVLALEEQQRRAQAQRTRYEEKIAALEHELAAGGYRRERKFLFF